MNDLALRRKCYWETTVCPYAIYRETDPARLPQDKLAQVMAWEFGPKGLLLLGKSGAGKTRAAYLLLHKLYQSGIQIRTFDCLSFGHECARKFRDGNGELWADALAAVPLVFLDDLGKTSMTETHERELFGLIERRTANKLPIIATCNMTGAELIARMTSDRGEPLVRRLREFCTSITF